jgi:signal transduction histidine kinase/ligand-binding sensor domain-containing protein
MIVFLTPLLNTNAQYRIDTWTTDNGLPQNSVTGLTQTRDGYIWFTTNDGLVRFDGLRFKVFNKSNTPEITTNRTSGAFTDKSGRLWFHTEDGGTLFYEKGAFHVAAKPGELPSGPRSPFFDDPSGGVIFYVNHQHFHYQDGKFIPLTISGIAEESDLVLADNEGGLWFSGVGRLQCIRDGNIKTYDLRRFSTGDTYKMAYEDRQGSIWLAYAEDQKQSLLRIKNDRVQSFPMPPAPVSHFAEDMAGNLWLSVYTKGLYRIEPKSVAADEPGADALEFIAPIEGISHIASGYLCPDREGGIWIGTNKGLARALTQIIRVFSTQDGLPEENVYPIYEDSAGSIWAGIWNNSLVKYEGGGFKTFLRTKDTFYITSLFEDGSGRLWIGNIDTLRYLDKGKPVRFTEQAGFSGYTEFSVIMQDRDDNLWFGTSHGLSRYSGGHATVFTTKDGLPDDYIVALLQASDGTIWVGTRGGLAAIEDGRVKAFTVADGLPSNYIRSLYDDSDHTLWVGSYDGGLTRFKDGKFTRFTMKDGLSSNGVFCILEDNRGWFWMNSNQGIFRVRKQELNDFADGKAKSLTSIAYNKQDGMLNVEGNGGRQPAGIKARDGRLWFPTAQGIAVVNPEAVTTDQIPPPVLIEEIVIDRNAVENEKLQSATRNQAEITLSPNQSNLEIDYTGISFINAEQVKFRYKLEGLDRDWNEVGTRRTAYYSYLPPGEYTFHAVAANRDGVWNTEGAVVRVKVLPPFYRTWGFITLCIFGVITLAFFVYHHRVGQLKRSATEQEEFARQLLNSQEVERGRIAAELHDGLSQSLVIIKNRAMLSLTKPDDHEHALEQLKEIADASTFAIDEVKDVIYDLRPIQLDRLGLTGAIEEIAEKIAGAHGLTLSKKIEDIDKIFPKDFENSIYRIVQESLNNIIKHAEATVFEVRVVRKESQVAITVKDNGKGFAAETAANNNLRQKSGFGLVGMVERAKLFGGQAMIESTEDAGTEVFVILPIPSNGSGSA